MRRYARKAQVLVTRETQKEAQEIMDLIYGVAKDVSDFISRFEEDSDGTIIDPNVSEEDLDKLLIAYREYASKMSAMGTIIQELTGAK